MVLLPEPDTPITASAHGVSPASSATKVLRQRGVIYEPDRFADGVRAVRGQVRAIKHARQDRALVRAGDLKQHFAAGAERRQGQRHPGDKWLDMRLRDPPHPALGLV